MLSNFFSDLRQAQSAEILVRDVFANLSSDYTFTCVGDQREYWYKGDVKATAPDGREIFIEVKNDSRIWETHNVLCEEEVYYCDGDYYGKGNMQSNYDIYVVVSQHDKKIYVIDFKVLKAIYKKGIYKTIAHAQQTTYCYLLALSQIKKHGGMIAELEY